MVKIWRNGDLKLRLVKFLKSRKAVPLYIIAALLIAFAFCLPRTLFDVPFSPVLYDRDGNLLGAQVASDGQWRFPGTDNVNERFKTALILAEDRRFKRHLGVDPLAIARATVQNIRGRKVISGGSTITMQTIRLSRGFRKRTIFEKGIEAVLALRLEIGRSKNDILALYAANAPFGANVVGLEAAAWRWYGRSPDDLSWAEAATLAVLPNNPAIIHPGRNRETLKEKRDALLKRISSRGFIDAETLALSLAERLPGEPLPLPRLAPHLLDRLVLDTGGASFTSAIDRGIQERAAEIINRASERFASNNVFNGACVVINTKTGEVAAYVGNTVSPHAYDVDVASSYRSSGSLLKPFLYAAMLDSGDILPSSLASDIPTRVGSFSPENNSRTYLGAVPADQALARSLNVPAARSLRVYGVDRFAQHLRSLGLTTLFRSGDDYGLPLILGGAEVTLLEIAGLYAGLGRASLVYSNAAADEVFFTPILQRADTSKQNVKRKPKTSGKSVSSLISPGAAWLTLEALVHVARPGEESVWQEYAGARQIAWKTGTSYGLRDAWSIGVTPEWTVGVWIGNASGEGRPELNSTTTAAPVLFEIFSALDSLGGNRRTWFSKPTTELRQIETCASSGFPASVNCAQIKFNDVPKNAQAAKACGFCQTVVLDENLEHRIVLSSGVSLPVIEHKWFVLPPAEEWYFRRWNLDYKPLPPLLNSQSSSSAGERILVLFNPEPNSQIYVPRELDGSDGRIVFSAAHRNENEIIFWHLDTQYLGYTQDFHEMEARPEPGLRTLTLIDSKGNTIVRNFVVLDSN